MSSPTPQPALFISHGSPLTALEPGAAGAAWAALGRRILSLRRPRAVLALSAHTLAHRPALLAAERHAAIHDFGGFDPRLQLLRYDAPGAPWLATEVAGLLGAAGSSATMPDRGGLDHGLWIPLRQMFPAADMPVLPLAWDAGLAPAALFALGERLAPLLGENVMLLASGGITHNLHRIFADGMAPADAPEAADVAAFRRWMLERSAQRDWEALLDYRRRAPHAPQMHPSDEHLLPWFVAAGAGGREHLPQRLHAGVRHGALGMDVYAFGAGADALQRTMPPPEAGPSGGAGAGS